MWKLEFFDKVMNKVTEVTEVSKDDVLHSNREECVDARYILVAVLSERLTDNDIAALTGWKRQTVNFIRNHVEERKRYRWSVRAGIDGINVG